jgi:Mrp family chromosome partitioning ATPase
MMHGSQASAAIGHEAVTVEQAGNDFDQCPRRTAAGRGGATIIAVNSQEGGVAKTTTCLSLRS